MPVNPLSASEREAGNKDKKNQILSGQSTLAATAPKGQTARAPGTPTSSGSFTNLQSYLEANKDQAGGLGSKLEENVQNEAQGGQSELDKASKEYDTGVEQAGIDRNAWNTDKFKDIVNNAYNSGVVSDDDVNAVGSIRNKKSAFDAGTFQAPKFNELNSYLSSQDKFNKAIEKAESTKSEAGRETLLRDAFARPSYTKGESSLDQLFVQNDPGNREKFQNLRDNLLTGDQSLTKRTEGAVGKAGERYAQEGEELSAANQDLLDLLYNPRGLEGTIDLGERPNQSINVGGTGSNATVGIQPVGNPRILQGPSSRNNALVRTGSTAGDVRQNTPVQDKGLLPDYGTRPEYGVLSYMDELFGSAPEKALQQQQLAEKNIRDMYLDRYSNQNTLGVDLDKLVNAGLKKSSDFTPGVENLISEEELARLTALNRLAGRDPRALGDKTIGELGPRFDAGVSFKGEDADKLIQQKAAQFKGDAENSMSFLNQPFFDGKSGAEALDDTVDRLATGRIYGGDAKLSQDVLAAYEPKLAQINDTRTAYGLPKLKLTSFYEGGSEKAAMLAAAKQMASGGGIKTNSGLPMNPEYFVKQVLSNPDWDPEAYQQVVGLAKLKALGNLLNANRQTIENPTSKNNPTSYVKPGTRKFVI